MAIISYSMCWEDPKVVVQALDVKSTDDVLSVASGGENVFALALRRPARLVAIDRNVHQLYLVQLKAAAIRSLDFHQCAAFFGFLPCDSRPSLYSQCKEAIDDDARKFWDDHPALIRRGIVQVGRFETYLRLFRTIVLPLVISRTQVRGFLSSDSIAVQREFYNQEWNTWRWRLLFQLFFSRRLMRSIGRDKELFSYVGDKDFPSLFLSRCEEALTRVPISRNFFYQYILTGSISVPFAEHPYLDEKNFFRLKSLVDRIEFVQGDVRSYLDGKRASFSKFNISDVFESMAQFEYEEALGKVASASKDDGIVCYWNNLVPRFEHPSITSLVPQEDLASRLMKNDRVRLYSRLIIEKVQR